MNYDVHLLVYTSGDHPSFHKIYNGKHFLFLDDASEGDLTARPHCGTGCSAAANAPGAWGNAPELPQAPEPCAGLRPESVEVDEFVEV